MQSIISELNHCQTTAASTEKKLRPTTLIFFRFYIIPKLQKQELLSNSFASCEYIKPEKMSIEVELAKEHVGECKQKSQKELGTRVFQDICCYLL